MKSLIQYINESKDNSFIFGDITKSQGNEGLKNVLQLNKVKKLLQDGQSVTMEFTLGKYSNINASIDVKGHQACNYTLSCNDLTKIMGDKYKNMYEKSGQVEDALKWILDIVKTIQRTAFGN